MAVKQTEEAIRIDPIIPRGILLVFFSFVGVSKSGIICI
jgi:hypothetical protein